MWVSHTRLAQLVFRLVCATIVHLRIVQDMHRLFCSHSTDMMDNGLSVRLARPPAWPGCVVRQDVVLHLLSSVVTTLTCTWQLLLSCQSVVA